MRKAKSNAYKSQVKTIDIHRITPGGITPFQGQNFGTQQQFNKHVQHINAWDAKIAAEEQYIGSRFIANCGYNHKRHAVTDERAVAFLNSVLSDLRVKDQYMLTVSISDDRMDYDPHPDELMDVDEPECDSNRMDVDEIAISVFDSSIVSMPMDTTEDEWATDSWAMDVDTKEEIATPFRPPGLPAFSTHATFASPPPNSAPQKAFVEQELALGIEAFRFPTSAPTPAFAPAPPIYHVPAPAIIQARPVARPVFSDIQNHLTGNQLLPSAVITSGASRSTQRKGSLTLEMAYVTLGVRSLEISEFHMAVVASRSSPTPKIMSSTALITKEREPIKAPVLAEVPCKCNHGATPPAEAQVVARFVSPITVSPASTKTEESSCFDTVDLLRLDFEDPVHSTPVAAGVPPYSISPESVELWEDLASLKGDLLFISAPAEENLLLFSAIPLAEFRDRSESLTIACEPFFASLPADCKPSVVSPAPACEPPAGSPAPSEPSSRESVEAKPLVLNVSAEGKPLTPVTANCVTKIMKFRYRRSMREKKRDQKNSDKRRPTSPGSSPKDNSDARELIHAAAVEVPSNRVAKKLSKDETKVISLPLPQVQTKEGFSAYSDRPIASNSRICKVGARATKSPLFGADKENFPVTKPNSVLSPNSPLKSTANHSAVSHDKPHKLSSSPPSTDKSAGPPELPSLVSKQPSTKEKVVVSTTASVSSPACLKAIEDDIPTGPSNAEEQSPVEEVRVSTVNPVTPSTDYLPYYHAGVEKESRPVQRKPFMPNLRAAAPVSRPRRKQVESVDRRRIRLVEPAKKEAAPSLPPSTPPKPIVVQAVAVECEPTPSQSTFSALKQWIGFRSKGEEFKVLPGAVPNTDYHDLNVIYALPLPPPSIWTRGMVRFFGWA